VPSKIIVTATAADFIGVEEIEAELETLSELRGKPAGTIRITAGEHAVHSVLWPKLAKLLPKYPDVKVEITVGACVSVSRSRRI
jgi:DNA-binding transcriptional LysR family regulator